MFAETLLESSPTGRKRKRWPMATAFTVETIIAAVLVIVPLLSTGVIPLSARMQPAPLTLVPVEQPKPVTDTHAPKSGAVTAPRPTEVVLISNNQGSLFFGPSRNRTRETEPGIGNPNIGSGNTLPNLGNGTGDGSDVKLLPKRIVSDMSPGQLINRVEPVYPRMAAISGVQGEVKLHAIIARDGRIISLSVMSGHPLLVRAAEDAVSQWRYRPYYLNGEPVEVETFITVHFTKGQP